ncbi:MAG TPA: site-2 protease family protein [Tepidisphaeraceae bacterium]
MAWDDRPHYRDRSGASTNPLVWLISGSVPMFRIFGLRFRAQSSLIIFVLAVILLDWDKTFPIQLRALAMAIWVATLILHELAHCFVARRFGGGPDEILLWPLGGLVPHDPPHKPMPTFVTAAAGPALNLIFCAAAGAAIYFATPVSGAFPHSTHAIVSLTPFHGPMPDFHSRWSDPIFFLWAIFTVNYRILLLNLLPILPLDGGHMLQSVLWSIVGNFRSMVIATSAGIAGAVIFGIVSMPSQSWFIAAFMIFCLYECYRQRVILRENGPEDWRESFDFSQSLFDPQPEPRRRRRLSRRAIRKARKIANQEKAIRDRIDEILAKVSAQGLPALNWYERRTLRKTTEAQRRRESELSQFQ